ncbi:ribosomal protein S12 methylthiotransferase RimO [Striga asiatica]|uniref:Ribosomal protein S12 methylthiotransferase RimO n=1 Tax=Striga asiatica TaxID=4170 RepID=A0A5A7Q6B6_STRAF|nr:ribosomal protein S12 methylthiotransferase RimO [Striga asiatica]
MHPRLNSPALSILHKYRQILRTHIPHPHPNRLPPPEIRFVKPKLAPIRKPNRHKILPTRPHLKQFLQRPSHHLHASLPIQQHNPSTLPNRLLYRSPDHADQLVKPRLPSAACLHAPHHRLVHEIPARVAPERRDCPRPHVHPLPQVASPPRGRVGNSVREADADSSSAAFGEIRDLNGEYRVVGIVGFVGRSGEEAVEAVFLGFREKGREVEAGELGLDELGALVVAIDREVVLEVASGERVESGEDMREGLLRFGFRVGFGVWRVEENDAHVHGWYELI